VALLAGTGTLQAWREVGSWSGFVGTAYGRLVLAKLAVFGGVLALGGLAWLAVRRARDPARRLRRIVPLELLGVAAILGVTAVLVTATPPGRPVRAAVEAGPTQVTLPVPDGGTAELRLLPATVGQNDVHIAVLDVAGHPRAVTEARLRVGLDSRDLGPFDISLRSHGTGLFGGRIALPYPGDWRVNLVVRTTDVDTYALSTTVRVAAPLTR